MYKGLIRLAAAKVEIVVYFISESKSFENGEIGIEATKGFGLNGAYIAHFRQGHRIAGIAKGNTTNGSSGGIIAIESADGRSGAIVEYYAGYGIKSIGEGYFWSLRDRLALTPARSQVFTC